MGYNHACALLEDGAMRCWGTNQYGQLGDGTTAIDRFVSGGTDVEVSGFRRETGIVSDSMKDFIARTPSHTRSPIS
jgi:alpha-tubulin suppressor-like RCC1 family protein